MLVGKVGAGKTSVMNTLLMSSEENEKPASEWPYGTEECQREEVKIGEQTVVIVDTPGLCNAEKTNDTVMTEIKRCMTLTAPGPHVFLFVLSCLEKFTKEDQDMVNFFIKSFFGENGGEKVKCYTMALFTNGDELKEIGQTIKDFVESSSDLKSFVDKCNDEYHVIDNTDQSPSQGTELVQLINRMVQRNEGKYYREEMLMEAEKEGRSAGVVKRIALSINGCALAGGGLGGAVSHFAGSSFGVLVGIAAGAAAGGVLGCVGIVAVEHIKAYSGRMRRGREVRGSAANL